MKKTLIALAAVAATGAAWAESSVTLYGVVDTGFQYSKAAQNTYDWNASTGTHIQTGKTRTTTSGFSSGTLSGSRWGLKGQEALGNGLSAVFNAEAGFDSSTGAFAEGGFNRRSVVGLGGSFGTVVVGLDRTPLDNWGFDIDGNTKGDVAYTETYTGVFYSGEFSGFKVDAMLGRNGTDTKNTLPATQTDTSTVGWGYGVGLSYSNGPVAVGGAFQQFRDTDKTTTTVFAPNTVTVVSAGTTKTEFGIGASYDFGPAKLFTHYMSSKNKVHGSPDYSKWEHANIGVSVPVGAATLMAEYGRNRVKAQNDDVRLGDTYGPLAAGVDTGNGYRVTGNGNNFMVGANYAFSKRTDAYLRAGRASSLDAKVYDTTVNSTYLGKFDGNKNYVQIGLRHTF